MRKSMTKADLEREITALETMDTKALQVRWREVFKIGPPARVRADFLRCAISYRLQERTMGGLKPAAVRALKKRAAADRDRRASRVITASEGMDTGPTSVMPRKRLALSPGSQLVREWNGRTETVDVVQGGYVWKGQWFRTLSAVANSITGGRWSGPRFFGLLGKSSLPALTNGQSDSVAPYAPIALPGLTDPETV